LVSGWQPAGAAEGGGAATAACVVGAAAACVAGAGVGGAAGGGACDAAEVVRVLVGCVLCAAAARVAVAVCAACWLGDPLAVAEAGVVSPAVVPDECDPPEFAATTMMISATKASSPVSALCRAGQDLPRRGGCPWGPGGP
jgi:hypothetical protein